MKDKILNLAVITIVAVAAVVFVRTFVNAAFYSVPDRGYVEEPVAAVRVSATGTSASSEPSAKNVSTPARAVPMGYPKRLSIPALGVDAAVQKVGLNQGGAIGVPSNYKDVAWYSGGTIPGDSGTAYIDGHLDNGLGLAGVFKHLGEAKVGDDIYVTRDTGEKLHFVVTDIAEYGYDDPETTAIHSGDTDGQYLKLITCGGKWVPERRTYDMRVVVSAKLTP